MDNNDRINLIEFKKAIRNLRLDITDYECEMVFSLYELEGSGLLDYEEFMNLLIVFHYKNIKF